MIKIKVPYGGFTIDNAKIDGDNPIFEGLFNTIDMEEIEPSFGDVDAYFGRAMVSMLPDAKIDKVEFDGIDSSVVY